MIDFVCDDVLNWAKNYTGPKFHAMLLDGPYHLNFMGKKWDASGPDAICFQPDTWAALSEHLHDGAFIMAFGGSRTYHRMACAIEDAGFVLHSMIAWSFGSGFPKATRIDTQIDKAAGAERAVIGVNPNYRDADTNSDHHKRWNDASVSPDITAPATPLAQTWQGHRYGLQALKPAMEPICIAQKPYAGRPVDSIVATGAGALNIDGGRISASSGDLATQQAKLHKGTMGNGIVNAVYNDGWVRQYEVSTLGRWPSNFLLSHSPSCTGVCSDDCPVAELARQSGECKSGGAGKPTPRFIGASLPIGGNRSEVGYGDTGSAARFFYNADFSLGQQEAIDNAAPFYYCAKASRGERDKGLEGMPLHHLAEKPGRDNCLNSKRDLRYEDRDMAITTPARNNHPTVKPLKLLIYLSKLLGIPDAYTPRRLLNPFGGSGSESIAAMLSGQWDEIVYIEREPEYVEIAKRRAAYWQAQQGQAQPTLFKELA